MRPFRFFGIFLVAIGLFALLLAIVDYAGSGGACLGGRTCPSGYAAWYQLRVLLYGCFGAIFLALGLALLVMRPRRRFAGYGGYAPGGGMYGPRRGGWGPGPGGGMALRACPKCGARNGPHFQYCHRCGTALGGPGGAGPPLPPQ